MEYLTASNFGNYCKQRLYETRVGGTPTDAIASAPIAADHQLCASKPLKSARIVIG